jgi:hypothetical protein
LDELLARVDRAGASGPKLLRADSGFWDKQTFKRLDRAGWQFSIGVRLQPAVRAAIEAIGEADWQTLPDYPKTSIAQIAETTLGGRRLVVRRVRTLDRQGQLLPTWELFPFVTNRTDDLTTVEAEHRQHAVVERAIRDLKDQALAHFPSGLYFANAAWTVIAALPHNLLRWTSVIGLPRPDRPRRPHPQATAAGPARPADTHSAPLDAAPASPLALAARLRRSARAHQSARARRLTARPAHHPTGIVGPPPPAALTAAPNRTRRLRRNRDTTNRHRAQPHSTTVVAPHRRRDPSGGCPRS